MAIFISQVNNDKRKKEKKEKLLFGLLVWSINRHASKFGKEKNRSHSRCANNSRLVEGFSLAKKNRSDSVKRQNGVVSSLRER
jgi:hypothetical protein